MLSSLKGQKTQTRRVVNPQPELASSSGFSWKGFSYGVGADAYETKTNFLKMCPYGRPGDRLWVRETFVYRSKHDRYYYQADHPVFAPYAHNGWKPSIFMPRKACRLVLEITKVDIQQLDDITDADCMAEGIIGYAGTKRFFGRKDEPLDEDFIRGHPRLVYLRLWDKINAKRGFGWTTNPWVWVLTYKKVEGD